MTTRFLIDHPEQGDPAINLALEEYVLRHLDIGNDYFLLYINHPCVIVGRHQNVFEEVHLPSTRKMNLPIYRRISGGGTVYHDRGNINFSFITRYQKHKFNNYLLFNAPILERLRALGVAAEMDGRNDILVGKYKISGNAQFTSRDRMVSHGTLLFDTQLDALRQVLSLPSPFITSRAIKSVRSPVTNIREFLENDLDLESFKRELLTCIFPESPPLPVYSLTSREWKIVHRMAEEKYRRWEWIFGESPPFVFHKSGLSPAGEITIILHLQHGRIVQAQFLQGDTPDSRFAPLAGKLRNIRYDPLDISKVLESNPLVIGNQPHKMDWISDFVF